MSVDMSVDSRWLMVDGKWLIAKIFLFINYQPINYQPINYQPLDTTQRGSL